MNKTIRESFVEAYGREPEVIAHAPGRIEFIGNHTDYNAGPVLGVAIDRGVRVALARRDDGLRRLASDGHGEAARLEILPGPFTKQAGDHAWTNYPLGVFTVLPSFGFSVPAGFDYLAASDLPIGAGLSSSAAIELASALAFLAVTGRSCPPDVLAQIGRKAENDYVGVPCGILDQGVSAFGRADHLVHIDCRALAFTTVPLPGGLNFWIFNTHTKHALVDGMYAERHRECMEAAATLDVAFLADATLGRLEAAANRMPAAVVRRARHVIEEIARVAATVEALAAGDIDRVGALLTASHRSSRHLFENSTPELDQLVDSLVEAPGVFGARLTGGGFGGAVLALTGPGFDDAKADAVAEAYACRFRSRPKILRLRSGDGARVLSR